MFEQNFAEKDSCVDNWRKGVLTRDYTGTSLTVNSERHGLESVTPKMTG